MSNYEFFKLSVDDGVAIVTLDLPPLNILHNPMLAEFNTLLEIVTADADLAAIVIGSNGKAFSAGVDIRDHAPDKISEMLGLFHGVFRKLASTDALTIAAVNGAALGGGCELACFCDVVLASDRSRFGQPEVKVGVFPPVAASILPIQIGIRKAVELNALGEIIDAAEAHRIGLVSHVYPAAEFDTRMDEYLADIHKLSRPVVRLSKRATSLMAREQILAHLEQAESLYLNELMALSDAHEGIEAFMEKRTPKWKHA